MGLTVGPRQFNFMAPKANFSEGSRNIPSWVVIGNVIYYEGKLDLRAFSDGENKGLDLLNIALQEGGPWTYTDSADATPSFLVMDVITSVKMSEAAILDAVSDLSVLNMPGFLSDAKADNQKFNTSQIIYGQWRSFGTNTSLDLGASIYGQYGMQVFQSGTFGQGEVIVGPAAFYTRVVAILGGTAPTIRIPAANVVCSGAVVELAGFQELNQMARMSAR